MIASLEVTHPVCLAVSLRHNHSWCWHARFRHLNFDALGKMAQAWLVRRLSHITHHHQICDGCLVGKQGCLPFPQAMSYRVNDRIDLVHGDLCGPIMPATYGGKKYFLLLVDDMSRYMWVVLLHGKDEAADAVKRFQASVEVEAGRKLHTLRTNQDDEFTSVEFGE